MIEIKLETSNVYIKAQCVLCLRVFEREGIDALLYEDNEMKGYVCEECMKAGSENFPPLYLGLMPSGLEGGQNN